MKRALIVEDDPDIVELVVHYLSRDGWRVEAVANGSTALGKIHEEDFDLLILDLQLPGLDGLSLCTEVRRDKKTANLPVVMLTARGEEADRIVGLELGADDYVVKPFAVAEVISRIRAVLRRARSVGVNAEPRIVTVRDLELDLAARRAWMAGGELELTRKEFDLLARLAADAGRVVTREVLMSEVWDENWFGSTKTLDVHISGLRRKLGEDPATPGYIQTVRGVGFRLATEDGR